jgi:hypothetical protein
MPGRVKGKRGYEKDENMRDWLRSKARKTPSDVALFYTYFRGRGETRVSARDLALKTDGQAWQGSH